MGGHGDKNYTRSLREEIKAKQEELKGLKAQAKEERGAKKGQRDSTKTARMRFTAQARFILRDQPAQVETATQLLDGLFNKRELVGEFKEYHEKYLASIETLTAGKKKGKKEAVAAAS